ncbi:GNAT family N-acetyltransferase [Achromobacter arsenitoxydans]|uniref:Fis family transcriptional regulator n=1 Tax=Achromobacter arsenitoxydans SY8 TaxID=477184 RepID=H0FC22_9BURK|nr:GNAT family N-acetyltransferase [Achromobacter arsenitoxydans]EHK64154.1 Fis family transcriptional regulator [Achromobacter arsenitoxydans SY8]
MLIRLARPEDAALLPAIESSAADLFRSVAGLEWIAGDGVLPVATHQRLIAQRTVWVAQAQSGALCGFVDAEVCGDELHIWELAVDAGHQQMGIGGRLMRAACQHARAAGLSAVTLTTFRDLPWNAPWYARLGFREADAPPGSRLADVLAAEAAHGLPAQRRVALRLPAAAAQ